MILLIRFIKRKLKKNKRFIYRISFFLSLFVVVLLFISLSLGKRVNDGVAFIANKTELLPYDFDGNIYFNNTDGFEAYYQETIRALESAEKSIQIVFYSISDENIVRILEKKQESGVEVNIVVPKSKHDQHNHVFSHTHLNIIEVGEIDAIEDVNELMHDKFIIIDFGYPNEQLLLGSLNLTYLQQKYDSGFLLVTRDNSLINVFHDEFSLLRDGFYGRKKISSGKFKPYAFNGVYKNGFVDIWFGPGFKKNNIKDRMIEAINNANSSISVIGWRFNDDDLYYALERKARQGIPVTIILDDHYMWDEFSITQLMEPNENIQILSDSFMDIIFSERKDEIILDTGEETFNSFVHHHTLIIDNDILFTGTNNWSYGGFYFNDETTFVTDIENIVDKYVNQFTYLYHTLHGEDLNVSVDKNSNLKVYPKDNYWDKIIVYVEKNDSSWLGDICMEVDRSEYHDGIYIPERCNTDRSRIFLVRMNNELVASAYLHAFHTKLSD